MGPPVFLSSQIMTFSVLCPRQSLFGDGCSDASLSLFFPLLALVLGLLRLASFMPG